jgi:hypothetical protein
MAEEFSRDVDCPTSPRSSPASSRLGTVGGTCDPAAQAAASIAKTTPASLGPRGVGRHLPDHGHAAAGTAAAMRGRTGASAATGQNLPDRGQGATSPRSVAADAPCPRRGLGAVWVAIGQHVPDQSQGRSAGDRARRWRGCHSGRAGARRCRCNAAAREGGGIVEGRILVAGPTGNDAGAVRAEGVVQRWIWREGPPSTGRTGK